MAKSMITRRQRKLLRRRLIDLFQSLDQVYQYSEDLNYGTNLLDDIRDLESAWERLVQEASHQETTSSIALISRALRDAPQDTQLLNLLSEIQSPSATMPSSIVVPDRSRFEYKVLPVYDHQVDLEKNLLRFGDEGWELQAICGESIILKRRYRLINIGPHTVHVHVKYRYIAIREFGMILGLFERIYKGLVFAALRAGKNEFNILKDKYYRRPEDFKFSEDDEIIADRYLSDIIPEYSGSILEATSLKTGNSVDWIFRIVQFGTILVAQDLPLWKDILVLGVDILINYFDALPIKNEKKRLRDHDKKNISISECRDPHPVVELAGLLKNSRTIQRIQVDVASKSKWSFTVDYKDQ